MESPPEVAPEWQQWLLSDRPRLSHFLVGALTLLLPVGAGIFGPAGVLPAMGIAAIIGGGLGIGWTLACGLRWLRASPVMAVGVLTMALASLGNLHLMPRWEVLLRSNVAAAEARTWVITNQENRSALPPLYNSGDGPVRFATTSTTPADGPQAIQLFTPKAFNRWSLFGRTDSCFMIIRRDGSPQVLRTRADLDAALGTLTTAP
jgi:hypothetical protein